ncbi:MAG: amiC [Firmicutes bacterium]|nr:amiC [Bacillota bacterium]
MTKGVMQKFKKRLAAAISVTLVASVLLTGCSSNQPAKQAASAASDTIKVGILHSLNGTMAISEVSVKDAELHICRLTSTILGEPQT